VIAAALLALVNPDRMSSWERTEIVSGLGEGEVVVATLNVQGLADGMHVRETKQPPSRAFPMTTMSTMSTAVIDVRKLERDFRMGDSSVRAARCSLRVDPGSTWPSLALGLGKTHPDELDWVPRYATPANTSWTAKRSRCSTTTRFPRPQREDWLRLQTFNLLARTTALDNVALPLAYADVSRRKGVQPQRALERVSLAERQDHRPSSFPEASANACDRTSSRQRSQVLLADELPARSISGPAGNHRSVRAAQP